MAAGHVLGLGVIVAASLSAQLGRNRRVGRRRILFRRQGEAGND